MDVTQYLTPIDVPVCPLDCTVAFRGLTPQEKLYAHYMSRASYAGSLIVLAQTSVESPGIFVFLMNLFSAMPLSELKEKVLREGVPEESFKHLLQYAALFFANMGNYLGFGDTKFIPRIPEEELAQIAKIGGCEKQFSGIRHLMYKLDSRLAQLGLENKGVSAYYNDDIKEDEVKLVQEFMDQQRISAYNTRLFRTAPHHYDLLIASAEKRPEQTFSHKDATIRIVYGDHSQPLAEVVRCLKHALEYAANDVQREMIMKYIQHFAGGDINDHKDAQRAWIHDKGPAVETNIGFIESYRDPFGVRGEFEGFVAVVNREMTAKFAQLVSNAPEFIAMLPWPKEFEKDSFTKPDFTSLDVLTFASSGIPAGINIPNYDDIRNSEGFKNVALGNVISAKIPNETFTFLRDVDQQLYSSLLAKSFEVQVGLHELLGHGSGKMLFEGKFDVATTLSPITGKPVETFYKEGQTYDGVFSVMSSSFEECRAECVGVFLCTVPEILRIFGYEGQAAEDIYYVNWLNMVRAGVLALEFYTPETKQWRQAHMWARYCILKVLMEAGEGLVTLTRENDLDVVVLDRAKILSVGRPAISAFLQKLNVYKATADFVAADAMYKYYTDVPPEHLELRQTVLARKKPRKIFAQPHTSLQDKDVILTEFDASAEGMVLSNLAHFSQLVRLVQP